jgi:hypothetical protein
LCPALLFSPKHTNKTNKSFFSITLPQNLIVVERLTYLKITGIIAKGTDVCSTLNDLSEKSMSVKSLVCSAGMPLSPH